MRHKGDLLPSGPVAADQEGYSRALLAFGQPNRASVVFYTISNLSLIAVLLKEQPLSYVFILLIGACATTLSALVYTGLP